MSLGAISTRAVTNIIPGLAFAPVDNENNISLDSAVDGLTAKASGNQTNGTPITAKMSRFTTVATTDDSCVLPPSVPGLTLTILNSGVATLAVFPSPLGTTTEKINSGGANALYALTAGNSATFKCYTAGQWYVQQGALS